ncbi:glycosyltransferase [Fertoebacter nigrum]|uniref:Glycosyltransferase n=1 Tax=Fertoeibacter niger TaxID=2656921 RepID=A0A8X8GZ46_9RHOB|nr:glycosyltransferase [Fertoeibacter niger]NUB43885.1 glycosyltransferase [Fertoeibacter niger]
MTAHILRLLPKGDGPMRAIPAGARATGISLLRDGLVAPHAMVQALAHNARGDGALGPLLLAHGMISEQVLYPALAGHSGLALIDPVTHPPDTRLIDRIGARVCLRHGLLPWRDAGGATVVIASQPEAFLRHRDLLETTFGPVIAALAPAPQIATALLALRGAALRDAAETRVPAAESCRISPKGGVPRWALALLAGAALLLVLAPAAVPLVLLGWAALTLALATGLKLAAALVMLRPAPPGPPPPLIARLPVVSVMVALYHEADIAPRLLARLGRLDYPPDRLDILLVVEECDHVTRAALQCASLPPMMRVVVVPDGPLKTKPRALNFGLDHCRGSIIGVYDAEDAPDPDQIRRVVARFHQRGAEVACLQGILDFYNPCSNWLSRCFTIEYATWFRILLPGMQRLGLALPLGGTTLFFRRKALEELGGWDAHNVTEDADLGMRLARHGYRTELIDTVTLEEANGRALPWIRQRSRWLKGYMLTWAVHMRDPVLLWRQLGPRKFAGFQVLFLGTLSQFLLAPLLWSFWLVPLGLPHPLADALPGWAALGLLVLFALTEAVNITLGIRGLRLTRHGMSAMWVPTLALYFPLGALASYKAVWELVRKPFYWDKTSHGVFIGPGGGE